MTQLMAHCDTNRVSEERVMEITAGEYTKTFHPIAHSELITALEGACGNYGVKVLDRKYSINQIGTKMFGVWNLDIGNGEIGYSLGLRNSIDKSMAVGVCSGTCVFVCDNLCFSGDFIAFRKHTSGLTTTQLSEIANNALGGAIIEMEKMHEWQKSMHEMWVPKQDRKGLVYDMIDKGVISGGKFDAYHNALKEEKALIRGRSLDGTNTLFNMHGAVTRMMRGDNLLKVSKRTGLLNKVCEDYIEYRKVA